MSSFPCEQLPTDLPEFSSDVLAQKLRSDFLTPKTEACPPPRMEQDPFPEAITIRVKTTWETSIYRVQHLHGSGKVMIGTSQVDLKALDAFIDILEKARMSLIDLG